MGSLKIWKGKNWDFEEKEQGDKSEMSGFSSLFNGISTSVVI